MTEIEIYKKITVLFTGVFTEEQIRSAVNSRVYPQWKSLIDAKVVEIGSSVIESITYFEKLKVYQAGGVWTVYPKLVMKVVTTLSEERLHEELDTVVLSMRTRLREPIEDNGGTITELRFKKITGTFVEV